MVPVRIVVNEHPAGEVAVLVQVSSPIPLPPVVKRGEALTVRVKSAMAASSSPFRPRL